MLKIQFHKGLGEGMAAVESLRKRCWGFEVVALGFATSSGSWHAHSGDLVTISHWETSDSSREPIKDEVKAWISTQEERVELAKATKRAPLVEKTEARQRISRRL